MSSISVNLISKLASGTGADMVLLRDSPTCCGLALFRHFIQKAAKRIIYLSFDRTPASVDHFIRPIQSCIDSSSVLVDAHEFSPFGHITAPVASTLSSQSAIFAQTVPAALTLPLISRQINELCDPASNTSVFVDSLSTLLFALSPIEAARFLSTLRGAKRQVFFLIHDDVLQSAAVDTRLLIERADGLIKIAASSDSFSTSAANTRSFAAHVVLKRKSGKVSRTIEEFDIQDDGSIRSADKSRASKIAVVQSSATAALRSSVDPELSAAQRTARDAAAAAVLHRGQQPSIHARNFDTSLDSDEDEFDDLDDDLNI